MYWNCIQCVLNTFDLYSLYVQIFNLYSKYIRHVFLHIMGILELKNLILTLYGLFKYILSTLNYD